MTNRFGFISPALLLVVVGLLEYFIIHHGGCSSKCFEENSSFMSCSGILDLVLRICWKNNLTFIPISSRSLRLSVVVLSLLSRFQNLTSLSTLIESNPASVDALMKAVPLPFGTYTPTQDDGEKERPYLQCHYNFEGTSFRSPWTNTFYPNKADGKDVTADEDSEIRQMEVSFNEVWDAYRQHYYGRDAVGSVFLREREKGSASTYEGLFGISKECGEGTWSSVHLARVDHPHDEHGETVVTYSVESTVLLAMQPAAHTEVSAFLTKHTTKTLKVNKDRLMSSNLENLGKVIEDVEIELRSNLDRVHIPKTQEVVETLRKEERSSAPAGARPLGVVMDAAFFQKQQKMVEAFQKNKLK
jgi:capping protein beta